MLLLLGLSARPVAFEVYAAPGPTFARGPIRHAFISHSWSGSLWKRQLRRGPAMTLR